MSVEDTVPIMRNVELFKRFQDTRQFKGLSIQLSPKPAIAVHTYSIIKEERSANIFGNDVFAVEHYIVVGSSAKYAHCPEIYHSRPSA